MTTPTQQALIALQTKISQKNSEVLGLNDYIKKLQKELDETKTKLTTSENELKDVKKERDELKTYKTEKDNEEKLLLETIGKIDQSLDDTYAKLDYKTEVPSK